MKDLNGKSILFFSPRFFEYEKYTKEKLEELNAKVIWFDDRPSNSFVSKVLIRFNKKFINRQIENYYRAILKKLKDENSQFDYLFFLNPEAITYQILVAFKAEYSKAQFIIYMWDSFKNRKSTIELLSLFDGKFTFDSQDAKQYNLVLRPLFYIDLYKQPSVNNYLHDLLFVGTVHTDRYLFINKIINGLQNETNVKLHFFLNSKLLFWSKKIFERNFRKVKFSMISFRPLTHKDNSELIHRSRIILDINHPKQIGLTIRTLETLGAQRKLITTNADVVNYDFYIRDNILVIDRFNPVIPKEFLLNPYIPLDEEILQKYSIKGWISDLFNLS